MTFADSLLSAVNQSYFFVNYTLTLNVERFG